MPRSRPSPLLQYSMLADRPRKVDERLAVYNDGTVWLWTLFSSSSDRRDQAGTYSFKLDAGDLAPLEGLAAELTDLRPTEGTQARNSPRLTLMVGDAPDDRGLLLSVQDLHELPAPLAQARAAYDDLLRSAAAAPLSVISLAWDLRPPGAAGMSNGAFRFTFSNPGKKPVSVLFRHDSFTVTALSSGEYKELWHSTEKPSIDLVDDMGRFLGGFRVPTRLPGGRSASVVFESQSIEAPSDKAIASCGGYILLLYPPGAHKSDDFPQEEFGLEK